MDNRNKKRRKIINKGSNYREQKTINWKKSKENIVEGLDNLIKGKLLSYKKISEESLISCKSAIITKVGKNISKLKT